MPNPRYPDINIAIDRFEKAVRTAERMDPEGSNPDCNDVRKEYRLSRQKLLEKIRALIQKET